MESTEPAPSKMRRRWPLVAAILALASLTPWWMQPRMDPRFVGSWHSESENPDDADEAFGFEIGSDGLIQDWHLPYHNAKTGENGTIQSAGPTKFKIAGDLFEVNSDSGADLASVLERLVKLVLGRRPQTYSKARIITFDGAVLVLNFEGRGPIKFIHGRP